MTQPELTPRGLELMRHAVGWDYPKNRGFRNYFVAEATGPDAATWLDLVSLGYATKRELPAWMGGGTIKFYVTRAGCEAIGLDAKETRKARGE